MALSLQNPTNFQMFIQFYWLLIKHQVNANFSIVGKLLKKKKKNCFGLKIRLAQNGRAHFEIGTYNYCTIPIEL